jgi:hypothetical protein
MAYEADYIISQDDKTKSLHTEDWGVVVTISVLIKS